MNKILIGAIVSVLLFSTVALAEKTCNGNVCIEVTNSSPLEAFIHNIFKSFFSVSPNPVNAGNTITDTYSYGLIDSNSITATGCNSKGSTTCMVTCDWVGPQDVLYSSHQYFTCPSYPYIVCSWNIPSNTQTGTYYIQQVTYAGTDAIDACVISFGDLAQFTVNSCTPNWSCGSWSSCSGGTQTRTCNDLNNCGTTSGKPSTSQSCTSGCTNPIGNQGDYSCNGNTQIECLSGSWQTITNCPHGCSAGTCNPAPSCTPNWNIGSWGTCASNGQQTRTCTDSNNCNTGTCPYPLTQSCNPGTNVTCESLGYYSQSQTGMQCTSLTTNGLNCYNCVSGNNTTPLKCEDYNYLTSPVSGQTCNQVQAGGLSCYSCGTPTLCSGVSCPGSTCNPTTGTCNPVTPEIPYTALILIGAVVVVIVILIRRK